MESHRYASAGIKLIGLEVVDTNGLTGFISQSCSVRVSTMKPVASFTATRITEPPRTFHRFNASQCTDLEDDVSALQVRWDWENDGTWDTDFTHGNVDGN